MHNRNTLNKPARKNKAIGIMIKTAELAPSELKISTVKQTIRMIKPVIVSDFRTRFGSMNFGLFYFGKTK